MSLMNCCALLSFLAVATILGFLQRSNRLELFPIEEERDGFVMLAPDGDRSASRGFGHAAGLLPRQDDPFDRGIVWQRLEEVSNAVQRFVMVSSGHFQPLPWPHNGLLRRHDAWGSALLTLELVDQLGRQATNQERAALLVKLDLRAQQVGFETDRQALRPSGAPPGLVERALIRGEFGGHPVILVADVVGESPRTVFIDQAGQLIQGDRRAHLGLRGCIVDQDAGLLARGVFWEIFALHEVAEGFEQRAGLAWGVNALLA